MEAILYYQSVNSGKCFKVHIFWEGHKILWNLHRRTSRNPQKYFYHCSKLRMDPLSTNHSTAHCRDILSLVGFCLNSNLNLDLGLDLDFLFVFCFSKVFWPWRQLSVIFLRTNLICNIRACISGMVWGNC